VAGVSRGDVCLYRFRGPDKSRPVLVLTRERLIPYLASVTVAPITSTMRGAASEVILDIDDGMKHRCAVNLHNTQTIPAKDLGKRVARLNSHRMQEVCIALNFALGCDR
jgi:mRNA interferase MazF